MKYINTRENGYLSNFYLLQEPIIDDMGIKYWTVEHYYMANKSLDKNTRIAISVSINLNKDPRWVGFEAKKLGRKIKLREDWEDVKLQVMKDALIQKYKQPFFKQKLLETGDAILFESNDVFWGTGTDTHEGFGKNHLGKLLMSIRADLAGVYF